MNPAILLPETAGPFGKRHPLYDLHSSYLVVRLTFADFDDFWRTSRKSPSIGTTIAAMTSGDVETLKSRVRARLAADADGRIAYSARAHAMGGHVPK